MFGGKPLDGFGMVGLVRRGIPVRAVQFLLESGWLTQGELEMLVVSRAGLARRHASGLLTARQSDRLLRVARVLAVAEETFGGRRKAGDWLRRPTEPLSGERPLDLLDTGEGARLIETLLARIAHGIAA